MAMGPSSGRGVKNDINVTPLVDVVLVLLIIFMVITPMLTRGKDVALPKANTKQGTDEPPRDPLVVSITADGRLWLETNEARGDTLEREIVRLVREAPGRPILLKGDRDLS